MNKKQISLEAVARGRFYFDYKVIIYLKLIQT